MSEQSRREFLLRSAAMVIAASAVRADETGTPQEVKWTLPARRPVKAIENEWIPLKDGTRLAMRLWLPVDAERTPVPVVLEYLPYRKRDGTRVEDQAWAESFTPYGFAFARVDIRGSGDSDGVLLDEYLRQEQDDALEVIAWLARQPWCTGKVGMRGISWGGFNSLQVAARSPPALRAIMSHCATDNRYTDDAHYVGGGLTLDNYDWGAEFKNVMIGPPDPEISGDRWRSMWLQRLNATPPILAKWLSHQRFDSYWKHGSVAVDYSRIKCPTYLVDGQVDSYRDFLPRMLAHLNVPRKGLFGPWGHHYPQIADPGPGLDWTHEEVRWWSRWLNEVDSGIMSEPMLRAYLETRTASEVWPKDVPGRWVAEDTWPSLSIVPKTWALNVDGLAPSRGPVRLLAINSQETLGLTKREWYPWNLNIDLPPDQTPDDQRSRTFDSPVLDSDLEIMGNPQVTIRVRSDQPIAKLAVRLNELRADGKSWNVSYGVLNLAHRNGHENPEPLQVGRDYDVTVPCYFTAHRFEKGSRIRVAVSESIWPLVWPSPRPVTLQITSGVSVLILPVRPPRASERPLDIPVVRDRVERAVAARPDSLKNYQVTQTGPDAKGRVTIHKRLREPEETLADIGTTVSSGSDWILSITEGDPNSSVWNLEWFERRRRGSWDTTTRSMLELTSTPEDFHIRESVHALEGDKVIFERSWQNTIKRDFI
jgi:putative CocE/NonD family hydrolase